MKKANRPALTGLTMTHSHRSTDTAPLAAVMY